MKIRGFLAIFILVLAIVLYLWIAKGGKKAQVIEKVEAYDETNIKLTKMNMATLEKAIDFFIASEGRTPKSLGELQVFRAQAYGKLDAWGTSMKYERLSDMNFRLISAGKDRIFDTQDDIVLDY